MSFVNGRKYICDRCLVEKFCKCTGEGATDGGFTRWNNFEPLPEGWESHRETGLLCPECNSVYRRMIDTFIDIGRTKEDKDDA